MRSILLFLLLLPLTGIALADALRFDIPAQPLPDALKVFADQAKMQLLYKPDAVGSGISNSLVGDFEKRAALEMMLKDTGLEVVFSKGNAATIRPAGGNSKTALAEENERQAHEQLKLAQGGNASTANGTVVADGSDTGTQQGNDPGAQLEEIVVTAQKRIERLQDVPVPVTAINADALINTNQLRLQDYYTKVPGLGLTTFNDTEWQVVIRGVSTKFGETPTVGILIDDMPYSAMVGTNGSYISPDIDPSNLARVEVLRGPQGTLYGASSLGGLLKFVTVDPSTEKFTGRVQVGVSTVRNSDDPGYTVRGSVNVPLSDTWAVRASAFTRQESGYVDVPSFIGDPTHGKQAVNDITANGGQLSAMWRPTEAFSLKLSALVQSLHKDGASYVAVEPGLGDLEQLSLRDTGRNDTRSRAFSATATTKIAGVDLTSISGYIDNVGSGVGDQSLGFLGAIANGFFNVAGAKSLYDIRVRKFSQEIRASASIGERFDWLLGGFYTHEATLGSFNAFAIDAATNQSVAQMLFNKIGPTRYEEYAAFADLTVHFTDRFDVQFGGRQSRNRQVFNNSVNFIAFNTGLLVGDTLRSKDNVFTYLVTPRLKLTEDLMLYARFASGYRPGGANDTLPVAFGLPARFEADKTQNYEVGFKGNLLDRKLSFDASVYYIDWSNIQTDFASFTDIDGDQIPDELDYVDNGGNAKSQGVELSLELRPLKGLTLSIWGAYNDAVLTEDLLQEAAGRASFFGLSGDRLPFSSRVSGSFSLDQEFPLTMSWTGFFGGSVSYAGDRKDVFAVDAQTPRTTLPAYARTDLNMGVRSDSWTANLYMNNVTDRRGVQSFVTPNLFTYIQPRTIGLSLARTF